MKRILMAGAATLLMAGIVADMAVAHERGGHDRAGKAPRVTFEQLDTDADGKITAAELQARAAARFAEADTNGDGMLSAEELQASADERRAERRAERTERMIERLDENDDGQLSLEELPERRGQDRMFERLDTDGDGAVSEEEFAKLKDTRGGRHKMRHGGGDRAGDK